jgi:peptidoglycan/xylan/chitin deacetylase (PgdA/CDA1 family)
MKKISLFLLLFSFVLYAQEEVFLGGIVRTDTSQKNIHLVLTSHEFVDGFEIISDVLKKQEIKASFFFTGDFYRQPEFSPIIKSLKNDGHYLGAHSDKHLLYCAWEKRDSTLVTKDEFINDVLNNYAEMENFGITKENAPYYLPPYEWYNSEISGWTEELGLKLVNFTPGTSSNQDWTIPSLGEKYLSSDTIYNRIMAYEKKDPVGLNGFILLIHFGTHPERTDKFYFRLDELVTSLKQKGYSFKLLNESLN